MNLLDGAMRRGNMDIGFMDFCTHQPLVSLVFLGVKAWAWACGECGEVWEWRGY